MTSPSTPTLPLSAALADIVRRASAAPRMLVLLDFDGTLAPFQDQPEAAIIAEPARDLLRRLAENPRVTVGIVSGRSIADLAERVAIEGVVYAGNHGIEIRGHGLHFIEPVAFLLEPALKKLVDELTLRVEEIPNVRIENKHLTATMNLRGVRRDDGVRASEILSALVEELPQFLIQPAKEAFDIVPRNGWNKGSAVQWIRNALAMNEALTIFAGDDVSDEDAFAVLTGAITIKVGEPPTAAAHLASSPSEIWALLTELETALEIPSHQQ